MRKNTRVVQIRGIRGLCLTLFAICCLIAGFVAFPALLTMNIWNHLAAKTGSFPLINFNAGVLLWAIIALSKFIFSKKKFIVSLASEQELSENEVQNVVSKIKELNNLNYNGNLNSETKEEESEALSFSFSISNVNATLNLQPQQQIQPQSQPQFQSQSQPQSQPQ